MLEIAARRRFFAFQIAWLLAGVPSIVMAQPGFDVLHFFDSPPREPHGPLVVGSDGALYGTAAYGGAFGYGIVFKVNPDGSAYTKLHDFDRTNGANPIAGLVKGPDGALYGTTQSGGANWGVVFKINENGSGFAKLYEFDLFTNGGMPETPLVSGNDGNLYGTTRNGGAAFNGVIFRITPAGAFTKLYDFDGPNGAYPQGALIEGRDGALYGTTFYGGTPNCGVVYKVNTDGSGFLRIHEFDCTNG